MLATRDKINADCLVSDYSWHLCANQVHEGVLISTYGYLWQLTSDMCTVHQS